VLALAVEGASWEPNTVRIPPGASACWYEAGLTTAVTAGVPFELDPDEVTLTVKEAVTFEELLYTALIVAVPRGNWEPVTMRVAVAVVVPAEPESAAEPRADPLASNVTEPVGVEPLDPVTVAIKYITSAGSMVFKLVNRVMASGLGAVETVEFQPVTSLYTSTEPNPIHWS
jgi:hypothetical protein